MPFLSFSLLILPFFRFFFSQVWFFFTALKATKWMVLSSSEKRQYNIVFQVVILPWTVFLVAKSIAFLRQVLFQALWLTGLNAFIQSFFVVGLLSASLSCQSFLTWEATKSPKSFLSNLRRETVVKLVWKSVRLVFKSNNVSKVNIYSHFIYNADNLSVKIQRLNHRDTTARV